MGYLVKEVFYTLQGEGARAGRPAVFCRFSGCNLWTGRERHRHLAVCQFCDTDFVGTDGPGGGRFATAASLADAVLGAWVGGAGGDGRPGWAGGAGGDAAAGGVGGAGVAGEGQPRGRPYVVCTGGEPLLQLDSPLVEALHERGFEVAVETNGTQPLVPGLDWVCVSPKAGAPLVVEAGDELKLVFPQEGLLPPAVEPLGLGFHRWFLQPMDGPQVEANTKAAVEYCLAHPQWCLSLQTHKMLGIP